MSKSENEKSIATIPTQSSANIGKIDLVSDLLKPYSKLMIHFLNDIDLRFVRDNELMKFTKAKVYQTEEQYDALLVNCHKRYQKQVADGITPTRSLKEQLEDIHEYAVQTPLSARFAQTCYSQTVEIYKSWSTKLEDVVRSYLTNSSVSQKDEFFLVSCYRINKNHYWYSKELSLKWHQTKDGDLLVPTKQNKANITLPVSEDILFFMRRLIKQARKRIRFPRVKQLKTLKLDEKVATLEVSRSATHFDYFLKLSTLEKGKPIYLPLNRNPYLDECLTKGEKKPFVQLRLDGKKCVISAIVEYDKAPLRSSDSSLGLDFGMVSMFTTSDGEQHGLTSFIKLKIWDEELVVLTKELQKQGVKFTSNVRYVQLQNRIKSYFKNEICRILNKLAKKNVGVFVVEQLDFRAFGLSRRMNRLIGRTYCSIVKAKLARLEEQFGIQIVSVNPAYTSQECSRCHYVSKNNRKSQKQFICEHCHLHCNADVNAGRVIDQRRSLISEFPVYSKKGTSSVIRCQVREASEECHRRYCLNNELSTINASLAESSL
jgi:transposase, IS605 orfB family